MTKKKDGIRGQVMATVAVLEAEREERRVPDPPRGQARDGIDAGKWHKVADPIGLPPDCPVRPLGLDGDTLFLVDALGQLASIGPGQFGQGFIQRIFGNRQNYLHWAWPRFGKGGEHAGFDVVKFREDMYHAAACKGLWNSVHQVRGRGAWLDDDGDLVLHCGRYLWKAGQLRRTGEVDGYFYPRRQEIFLPWPEPVKEADSPALQLFNTLKTWNWGRPQIDPMIMLGWMAASMLGGALPWRPSIFLTGDKATGKSSLQRIVKDVLQGALIDTTDTTPAGIYQRVHQDALPVAVDELEAEVDNRRASGVIRLARLAASGGLMLRGGADHKGIEFQARSTFLFSAINAPPMPPQDLSRMGVLSLQKLDPNAQSEAPDLGPDRDTIGPKLLRRLADGWHNFIPTFEHFRKALRLGGHDSRGQDTYGVFLTCAYLVLGDLGYDAAGYNVENFDEWADLLNAGVTTEKTENWIGCLHRLLTTPIDAWRAGTRQTIGAMLDEVLSGNRTYDKDLAHQLGQAGVGLVPPDKCDAGEVILAVPNKGVALARVFMGSVYGGDGESGVWGPALRQGPPHVVSTDKSRNRVSINGMQERCTLIDLRAFHKYLDEL